MNPHKRDYTKLIETCRSIWLSSRWDWIFSKGNFVFDLTASWDDVESVAKNIVSQLLTY
jgi:hypothetical protein